ncbi:MAG: M42 family metallopeptidase [Chloroflexi bacterium]|nr:M42 family metallopeptidase [Chloroflexota bacterium]
MKKLLQTLTETFGPSGYEDAVRAVVMKEIKPLADEVRVDALGNVIARVKPSKGAKKPKRVMLAAHMDEIGLIASHIDRNGFVRFINVGAATGRYTLGARVRFLNGISGVVGFDRLENFDESVSLSKMFIDVGASSPKDCPIKVGDVAAFERPFAEMGKRLVAKSMDDRAGVAVLIETMRGLKSTPHDVYFVFTTQEEVGTRGAATAAFGVDPDIGIAVDVTPVGDTPGSIKMEMKLGAGPCIKIRDVFMLADPRVVKWMVSAAEKARIPFQREVLLIGSTDARAIQLTRAGVATGGLSIPIRYTHSSSEMVDYEDLKNSVKLLAALLGKAVSF